MENRIYDTVNVNGATLTGAKVFLTTEGKINRLFSEEIGVVNYLFDEVMNVTYIWFNSYKLYDGVDDYTLNRIHLNGRVSEIMVKEAAKLFLIDNSLIPTDIDKETTKWLDTVIEYVNYQGNIIVIFFDKWYDINLMSTEVLCKDGIRRYELFQTYVAGTFFEDDKLVELICGLDYEFENRGLVYPSKIMDMAY